jgi:hypothetical protein
VGIQATKKFIVSHGSNSTKPTTTTFFIGTKMKNGGTTSFKQVQTIQGKKQPFFIVIEMNNGWMTIVSSTLKQSTKIKQRM